MRVNADYVVLTDCTSRWLGFLISFDSTCFSVIYKKVNGLVKLKTPIPDEESGIGVCFRTQEYVCEKTYRKGPFATGILSISMAFI